MKFTLSDTLFFCPKLCHSGYVHCKFNAIFPSVTHVWAQKCVTEGTIALNFPLATQFWEIYVTIFQRQKCVTQGVSRNLTAIPWVTNFPLVTQFSASKNVSFRVCLLYYDLPCVCVIFESVMSKIQQFLS